MPTTSAVLTFAALCFLLIIVPGPSVMFVISRGVALGRRVALEPVLGNAMGVYVQVGFVAVGLGAIIERSSVIYSKLKLIDPAGAPAGVQMMALGLVFVVIALVLDSLWAIAAGTARDWFAGRPKRLEHLGVAGGSTMIGLGLLFATSGRKE